MLRFNPHFQAGCRAEQQPKDCDQRHSLGKAKPAFFLAVEESPRKPPVSRNYAPFSATLISTLCGPASASLTISRP